MNQLKFLFFLYLFPFFVCADEVSYLKVPSLNNEDILSYKVGIRPYRKSGIRLQPEWINEKLIIHNYGHGGAGLTLSWGSAQEVCKILNDEIVAKPKLAHEKTIAILGAGVIGLCVADVLLDQGYKVNVYAEEFHPNTTSNVAAGFFGLFAIAIPEDEILKVQFDRIYQKSREKLDELSRSSWCRGVEFTNFYIFNSVKSENENENIEVIFSDGCKRSCVKKNKYIMKGSTYLKDLFENVQDKGAQIISKKFVDRDDILHLQEKIIINCAGLGSRSLFNDEDLIGIRGHIIHLKKTNDFNYLIGNDDDQDSFFIMPWEDRLVLGSRLTQEYNQSILELNEDMCNLIMTKARNFFSHN